MRKDAIAISFKRFIAIRPPLASAAVAFILFSALWLPQAAALAHRFDNSLLQFGTSIRQLSSVNDIAQDGYGFIWLAGENGLARYDGTQLKLYQSNPEVPGSLPNNYVWDLAVDKGGALWVATSAGLYRYNASSDRFEAASAMASDPLLAGQLTAIAFDAQNRLYVASTNGVGRVDLAAGKVTTWVPQSPIGDEIGTNVVFQLALDNEGKVWVASSPEGLARLDTSTGQFDYFYHDRNIPGSLSSNDVRTIRFDSKGRLWIGTNGGGINVLLPDAQDMIHLDYQGKTAGSAASAVVWDVMEDSDGLIWATVDQHGVLVFNPDMTLRHHFVHSSGDAGSLLSNRMRVLFEDINKDIWIGGSPFGASFLNRAQEHIITYQSDPGNPASLTHSAILSILETRDGTVWIGTEGGLNALEPTTGKITRYLSDAADPYALKAPAVLALEEDSLGNLWVGTWSGGLHRFDRATGQFHRYTHNPDQPNTLGDDYIWSIFEDSEGILWVGTEKAGLQRYRRATDDFQVYRRVPRGQNAISSNFVSDIIEGPHGTIWTSGYSGLNVFDKKTGQFRSLKPNPDDPGSFPSYSAKALLMDSRGRIWVGTEDKGVSIMDPNTEQFRSLGEAEGLPSHVVSSLVEDDNGFIWLATANGLARLHPDTLKIETFNIEHGLVGSTYNRDASLLDSQGRLYFGSTEGVTAFRPEDLQPAASVHPLWITSFRILNKEAEVGAPGSPLPTSILTTRKIQLDYSQSMFSFDFATLNFRNPTLNSYAYQLEGFDQAWHYVGHRNTATYTNLNPGRYVFRVQGKVPAGPWLQSGHSIVVDIAPPWWRTWWACSVYGLLLIGLGYGIYVVGHLKRNSNIFRELSIKDPLTGIYNRAGLLQISQGLFANTEIARGVCVMLMDIDHFKSINDTCGHDTGDRVIQSVTQIVRGVVRTGDYLGRWGGEEFVLLCSNPGAAGAALLAEKIRSAVAAHPFDEDFHPLNVTLSIGIALARTEENFEQALKRADEALYQAKRLGRNRVEMAD